MSIELTPEQAKALVDHVWTTLHHRSKDDSAAAVAAVREVERQLWARDEDLLQDLSYAEKELARTLDNHPNEYLAIATCAERVHTLMTKIQN